MFQNYLQFNFPTVLGKTLNAAMHFRSQAIQKQNFKIAKKITILQELTNVVTL